MTNKKTHRFTFMEMIAIMVIIIILTTILLPVAFKSKEWGKSIKCKSNMKTISDGVFSYAANSQGILPVGTPSNTGGSWTFRLQQMDYIPAPKKFIYTWVPNPATYKITGLFAGYPGDYSSVWACPSQEIAPQNRFLCNIIYGNPNYNTNFTNAGFYWQTSHYAMTRAPNYPRYCMRLQSLSQKLRGASTVGLLLDTPGAVNGDLYCIWNGHWGNTGTGIPGVLGNNLVWGRHWGNAYGITNLNYNSANFLEIGSTQINTVFLDGHAEAWNNRIWWNKYLTPLGYAKSPFTLIP